MQLQIEIRQPISPEEIKAYHQLRWKVLDEPLGILWSQSPELSNSHRLAFYRNGETIAVGMIQFNSDHEAQIREMATHPNFAAQGIGSKMIERLEKIAISRNVEHVVLNARNTAVSFYQKNGYQIISDLIHPMGLQCKRMVKNFNSTKEGLCALPESEWPWDLLIKADPSVDQIKTYIYRSQILGLKNRDTITGVIVLLFDNEILEIMNLAVVLARQRQGIGKLLINAAIDIGRKNGSKAITIGTGNSSLSQLSLYQKCGFRIRTIDNDFYTRKYSEQIIENGIVCRDMIRLSLDL